MRCDLWVSEHLPTLVAPSQRRGDGVAEGELGAPPEQRRDRSTFANAPTASPGLGGASVIGICLPITFSNESTSSRTVTPAPVPMLMIVLGASTAATT